MRKYETFFIVDPELAEEAYTLAGEKLKGIVNVNGGTVLNYVSWGKKKLAYEIKKQKRGHYAFFQFKAAPAAVAELERTYKLTDSVIKFLTVKLEKELRVKAPPKPKKKDAAKAAESGPATTA